jgi:large subunit ribosomal protein L10
MKKDYKVDLKRKAVKQKAQDAESAIADMKNYPTTAVIDLRKLPTSLLQNLRKKIREDGGKVLILKKPVLERVLKASPKLADKAAECNKPLGLILTSWSPYQLYKFFKDNRKKRAAKVGDVAPFDIIVPEGETDLPPGPALSELKTAGLNVQIKGGKIIISKDSMVAKLGEPITAPKVSALQKLNVKPFEISVTYMFGFDGKYVYSADLFAMDDTIAGDLRSCMSDAFNLSLNASYPTSQNIDALLTFAMKQSANLALNGGIYSSGSMEQLLVSALRQGSALESLESKAQNL